MSALPAAFGVGIVIGTLTALFGLNRDWPSAKSALVSGLMSGAVIAGLLSAGVIR